MTPKQFYDLPNIKTDKDCYFLEQFFSYDYPSIEFSNYNAFNSDIQDRILINIKYQNTKYQEWATVQTLNYQNEDIALFFIAEHSKKFIITNKAKLHECMLYLEEISRYDTALCDIEETDINEETSYLNEFYNVDLTKELLDLNHNFTVNVGDIVLLDVESKDYNGNDIIFKDTRCEILSLDSKSYKAMVVKCLDLKRMVDYKQGGGAGSSEVYHSFKYDVPCEPSDWDKFDENAHNYYRKILKEITEVDLVVNHKEAKGKGYIK